MLRVRVDLGISKITQDSPKNVIFGELDNLGRPTGVTATITQDMIGTGSKASQSIKPPGFLGGGPGSPGHARGHLLGNQLGGIWKRCSKFSHALSDTCKLTCYERF